MISFGVFDVDQRAGVDEDAAAVHDEGVEGAVVDDDDLDVLLGEAGGAQDRLRVVAQQLLDLGVADERQAARQLCARAGVTAATASRSTRATANAVSKRQRARCWRPARRTLIGASDFGHIRFGFAMPDSAQPSDAPRQGQRGLAITIWLRARRMQLQRSGRMRQQRGGGKRPLTRERWHDARRGTAADDAVRAQRCAAVHGDGRDGGGGPDRGRRAATSSTWRSASRRRRRRRRRSRRRRRRSSRPLGYTETLGIPSLRARIARHYARHLRRRRLDADRVVVTTGSSAGFILAFLSMFEPGDRVAIANPGYPPYRHILTALGCEPVLIETRRETRWAITGETLRAAHAQDAARRACWSRARPIRPAP